MIKTESSLSRLEKISVANAKIREFIKSGEIERELLRPNGMLRKSTSKSVSPLARYVHRMIQFESGYNFNLPITTQFYLQDFVNGLFGIQKLSAQKGTKSEVLTVYILRDGIEEMYGALDKYAQKLTEKYTREGRLPW